MTTQLLIASLISLVDGGATSISESDYTVEISPERPKIKSKEDAPETSETPPADKTQAKEPSTLPSDTLAAGDVTIIIKAQSGEEFKITSPTAHLEKIGELLRGKRKGSAMRTLVISVLASTATLVLSGSIGAGFQYVSWANSFIVSSGTDRVTKARDAFNEAIKAIGDRFMASRNFVAALQELDNNQAAANPNLGQMALDLDRTRMTDYYDKLKQWNVGYNALLSKIDYDLDRQIFLLGKPSFVNAVVSAKTNKVDCAQYITEEMRKVGYEQNSLKAQLAIINYCFGLISKTIDNLADRSRFDNAFKIDNEVKNKVFGSLDDVNTMTNTFQCYAKRRQEFYVSQIGASVINPIRLLRLFIYEHTYGHDFMVDYVRKERRPFALEQFDAEDKQCDPSHSAESKP